MSISSYIRGFIPPDDEFKKKKAAYDACRAAKVPIPTELEKFFQGETPDDAGVLVDLQPGKTVGVHKYIAEMQDGIEVHLVKLDPAIKVLRFVNSY